MKHLIIYTHPNPASLNSYLKNSLVEHLERTGHEIVVRDLYEMDFNPVLSLEDLAGQRFGMVAADVRREQDFIEWADCITVIHPIWWTGLPALMKGYIERVFSYGFAYRYDKGVQKGLLAGKQIIIINTHGKSKAEYEMMGMNKALLLTSDNGIYLYSGLDVKKHFLFEKADKVLSENIKGWETEIISAYKD
ncbi:MAG: flavodoxin family protein [Chitinophagaceae bacterium]|nr:MAG: flavodoxin family protein [Chitinophagaceae bacterium]